MNLKQILILFLFILMGSSSLFAQQDAYTAPAGADDDFIADGFDDTSAFETGMDGVGGALEDDDDKDIINNVFGEDPEAQKQHPWLPLRTNLSRAVVFVVFLIIIWLISYLGFNAFIQRSVYPKPVWSFWTLMIFLFGVWTNGFILYHDQLSGDNAHMAIATVYSLVTFGLIIISTMVYRKTSR